MAQFVNQKIYTIEKQPIQVFIEDDTHDIWVQQEGTTCHTADETIVFFFEY